VTRLREPRDATFWGILGKKGTMELRLTPLTNTEWAIVRKHVPRPRSGRKLPLSVLRSTVDGVLWRMRTGGAWHNMPKEYGNRTSIHRRFFDWKASGAWENIVIALAEVRGTEHHLPASSTSVSPYVPDDGSIAD
jgi:transposase